MKVIKLLFIVFVLLAGCSADLCTKRFAEKNLKNKPSVCLVEGFLDLRYSENEGLSFSLLSSLPPKIRRPLLSGLQLISTAAVGLFLFFSRRKPFFTLLPLLLVLSGAFGNVLDRLRYGYVVDFIYFHVGKAFSWPIFNIADILIAVGVGLMILQIFGQKEKALLFALPDKKRDVSL